MPDKYNYKERLPQSFPHGLPPSSLEPGATDQQYPPTYLFPDPPVGDGPELQLETPLQVVSHLQDAVKNVQELTGELARSLWEKATGTERHFPQQHFPAGEEELILAISTADMLLVHFTPAYLDNIARILNVEGYVPKEAIMDTGAAKAMCSTKFAAAIGVDMRQLHRGEVFVTASGAVERPLGVTKSKLKFNLGRGTDNPCVVEMEVILVDTTAYDVLLGMEFIRAVKGSHCSYTKKITYRCMDEGGHLRSSSINAPCHTIKRPVVAYAYFAGLISSEEDMQDAQCGFEDTIHVDDDCGFHTSPL